MFLKDLDCKHLINQKIIIKVILLFSYLLFELFTIYQLLFQLISLLNYSNKTKKAFFIY